MTEEIKHKKRKFLFNPLRRPLPYLGLMVGFVLIIFQQTIRNYVSDTLGEIVVSTMKDATGGKYKITYDLVRFDVISKELRISNLSVKLDTNVISKEQYLHEKPNLIDIKTPLVVIKLRSMLSLILNNQLYVSYIGAKNPHFSFIRSNHNTVTNDTTQIRKNNLVEVINNYFTALEIDSFRVESGSFNISSHSENDMERDIIYVGKFTAMLENFRLDSLSPSILLSGFNATKVEAEILNQEINIPETDQHIHFKRLYLSTSDSTITLDSLLIKDFTNDSTNDHSEVKVAQLKIQGLNFEKAYQQNVLFINKIKINSPIVNLKQIDLKKISQNNNDSTLSKSLYNYFKQLQINDISLLNGSVTLKYKWQTQINDFSTHLSNYTITPQDWKNRKLFSEIFINSFEANNISQELPDSIHITQIQKVKYSEYSKTLNLDNIIINPISGRTKYKTLQSSNINYAAYSNIKNIIATGFQPIQLLSNKSIEIDSLQINKPSFSILQYPRMHLVIPSSTKQNHIQFSVQHFITNNGSLKLRQNQYKESKLTQLNGIHINAQNLSNNSTFSNMPIIKLAIANGSLELKDIGHTVSFSNLSSNSGTQLFIEKATIQPDSVSLPYKQINAQMNNASIIGYSIENLKNQVISIDTLSIGKINIDGNLTRETFINDSKNNRNSIAKIKISDFRLGKSNINLTLSNSSINVKEVALTTQNITLDSIQKSAKANFSYNNLLLNFGKFEVGNKMDSSKFKGSSGIYSEKDSVFLAKNMQFISEPLNMSISLAEFEVNGLDKMQLQNNKILKFKKGNLLKPRIEFISQVNNKDTSLSLIANRRFLNSGLNGIQFNEVQLSKGHSIINMPSINKNVEVKRIDGIINNTYIDTLTTIYEAADHFKGTFKMHDIKMVGLTDTLTISQLSIDTDAKNIWTESFTYNALIDKNILRFESPGIVIRHINIPELLRKQISINQISSRNNLLHIIRTDSSYKYTKLKLSKIIFPYNIAINGINFNNTKLIYDTPYQQHQNLLNNVQFDIEVDSLNAKKNQLLDLNKTAKDSRFRTYGFAFNLPDSLNKVSFDTLLMSTKNSFLSVANLKFTPRYSKQEYGIKAGFQADWKDLLVKKIKLEKIDFIDLIENNTFKCQKLSFNNGYLNLYKDKQLPFPSDRVLPMEQDLIQNIKIILKLDTIEVNNIDISQSTLQSSGITEGSISFVKTNGTVTNITNDSLRLLDDHMMVVKATSNVMNKGKLTANFSFDMKDPDNLFFFDAKLAPMKAEEFNNILEATAFVSVKSGNIKSLSLQATGNSSYAYGNMSFLYNNLKVETINKKSLEPKGMGKVLKTFFANTFVVKKNNSKYKLLSRRGEMYYERDQARITLDYAAKTALTGVVSSIGARNNRKEIKQIKKDNKDQRDQELKLKKEEEKSAKKDTK